MNNQTNGKAHLFRVLLIALLTLPLIAGCQHALRTRGSKDPTIRWYPVGETHEFKSQYILDHYYYQRDLAPIEGIWIGKMLSRYNPSTNYDYQVAFIPNNRKLFPEYDYVGVIINRDVSFQTRTRFWKPGQIMYVLKKTDDPFKYEGVCYCSGVLTYQDPEDVTLDIRNSRLIEYELGIGIDAQLRRIFPKGQYLNPY
ncbi:MAG: hypothetical protein KDH09_03590 [Chrysiogenetes bacterium]|nr:hypothetical protein [Chrysiogenetes bacterium]